MRCRVRSGERRFGSFAKYFLALSRVDERTRNIVNAPLHHIGATGRLEELKDGIWRRRITQVDPRRPSARCEQAENE